MDPVILAALIGGISTILSPILVIFAKTWIDERPFQSIPIRRIRAIQGTWRGVAKFNEEEHGREIKLEGTVKTIRRKCLGYFRTENETGVIGHFHLEGIPLDYRYFKFDYRDKDQRIIRHGSMILMLSSDARQLNGRFIGYSVAIEDLIFGTVTLDRV
ncbi:hypothetical protein U2F10_07310 [Leptothoe sp. EHU-05/26/07-4]